MHLLAVRTPSVLACLCLGTWCASLVANARREHYVIVPRCPDLPDSLTATQLAWTPLMVIEGPQEPIMKHALQLIVDEFAAHDPCAGKRGIDLYDAAQGRADVHKPVLAYIEADLVMMCKLADSVGHSAKRACPRCAAWGCTQGGCVRWKGCNEPLHQPVPCLDAAGTPDPITPAPVADVAADAERPWPGDLGDYRVPPGLLSRDNTAPRLHWTTEAQEVPGSSWITDGRLKFSELEMEARARAGDIVESEAEVAFPMQGLQGDAALAQHKRQKEHANARHLLLGIKGTPVWAQLSYFSYAFFVAPWCTRMLTL